MTWLPRCLAALAVAGCQPLFEGPPPPPECRWACQRDGPTVDPGSLLDGELGAVMTLAGTTDTQQPCDRFVLDLRKTAGGANNSTFGPGRYRVRVGACDALGHLIDFEVDGWPRQIPLRLDLSFVRERVDLCVTKAEAYSDWAWNSDILPVRRLCVPHAPAEASATPVLPAGEPRTPPTVTNGGCVPGELIERVTATGTFDDLSVYGCSLAQTAIPLMNMRRVAGSVYSPGSPPAELGRDADGREDRAGPVMTEPLWVSQFEASWLLWRYVGMDLDAGRFCEDDLCPATSMTWWAALEFANRVSARAGRTPCYRLYGCEGAESRLLRCDSMERVAHCDGYRLPSEVEWEAAARSGVSLDQPRYGALEQIAWYDIDDPVSELARKRPTVDGIYNLIGNVFEWVEDPRPTHYDDATPVCAREDARVVRGGSVRSTEPAQLRSARRACHPTDDRPDPWNRAIGLRLVRAL